MRLSGRVTGAYIGLRHGDEHWSALRADHGGWAKVMGGESLQEIEIPFLGNQLKRTMCLNNPYTKYDMTTVGFGFGDKKLWLDWQPIKNAF